MAKSLSLAAHLALYPGRNPKGPPPEWPVRPQGPLVWFLCEDGTDLTAANTIIQQFEADREQVSFLLTGTGDAAAQSSRSVFRCPASPGQTRAEVARFLDHWKPDVLMWLADHVDPVVLAETDEREMPRYLVQADAARLDLLRGGWLPGLKRAVLQRFDRILATSNASQQTLIKWGADEESVTVAGAFEEEVPILSCNEWERRDVSQGIGTRPVWLAADLPLEELDYVIAAHAQASRQSHRLLLVISPLNPDDAPEIADRLTEAQMAPVIRTDGDPVDTTRAYVADMTGELGMWYRIAPITFMGGSFTGKPRHPFEAAALGSVVIHGPRIAPFDVSYQRLDAVGATRMTRLPGDLGDAVEALLSPDKAALMAHAAWQVTSQGAELTNQIVDLVSRVIDRKGR